MFTDEEIIERMTDVEKQVYLEANPGEQQKQIAFLREKLEKFINLPEITLPESTKISFADLTKRLNVIQQRNLIFDDERDIFPKSKLKKTDSEYDLKKAVNSFSNHINKDAYKYIKNNCASIDKTLFNKTSQIAVLSVDIRKSTHLMETALSENDFGQFLALLTDQFKKIVLDNYGVYDKFTGDGLICYFPEFFSGKDYLYYAINTAQYLHEAFKNVYMTSAGLFEKIFPSAGLGIGIDIGKVLIKMIGDDITIIGKPVINACRLNCAPYYTTYLNNQASLKVKSDYSNIFELEQTICKYKNDEEIFVDIVRFKKDTSYKPIIPDFRTMLLS